MVDVAHGSPLAGSELVTGRRWIVR